MLRITVTQSSTSSQLKLEGQVSGPEVEELRRLCRELSHNGQTHLILELSGVSFIDSEGIALVRQLTGQKVVVTNYSSFIAELLKEVAPCS